MGERIGENEAIFREVNERIQELNRGFSFGPDEITDFVCECSDESCFAAVRLTLGEYDEVRAEPTHFLVVRGHAWHPEAETVIRSNERFDVVDKRGDAGEIAEELDPRDE